MPLSDQVIYTDFDQSVKVDYRSASQTIFAPPGTVWVEMLPAKHKTDGGILLTDSLLKTTWDDNGNPIGGIEPSVGVVIAIGAEAWGIPNLCNLRYGDYVIVRDGDGYEYENFSAGNYLSNESVRVYGRTVPPGFGPGYIEFLPVEESIFATFNEGTIKAIRDNILIRKDQFTNQSSIILTPTHMQERTSFATIMDVGENCTPSVYDPETLELRSVKAGDRIVYPSNATWGIMDGEYRDYAFIRQQAVLALVNE